MTTRLTVCGRDPKLELEVSYCSPPFSGAIGEATTTSKGHKRPADEL